MSEDDEFTLDNDDAERPYTIVISANDDISLRANIKALSNHLINPRVKISLKNLAYTLCQRRTQLYYRASITTRNTELDENAYAIGKKNTEAPRVGFVFTCQGVQWSQMDKDLLDFFPWTRSILEELNEVLQSLPDPPRWSLIGTQTCFRFRFVPV